MNQDQLASVVLEQGKTIAALEESVKSAHIRLNSIDAIPASVNEILKAVAVTSTEVRLLTERFDKSIDRIEQSQKSQSERYGERIGALERAIAQQAEQNKIEIKELAKKVDDVRMEPGTKWKTLVTQIIALLAALAMGTVFGSNFFI